MFVVSVVVLELPSLREISSAVCWMDLHQVIFAMRGPCARFVRTWRCICEWRRCAPGNSWQTNST
jgi:hypothetical protein